MGRDLLMIERKRKRKSDKIKQLFLKLKKAAENSHIFHYIKLSVGCSRNPRLEATVSKYKLICSAFKRRKNGRKLNSHFKRLDIYLRINDILRAGLMLISLAE